MNPELEAARDRCMEEVRAYLQRQQDRYKEMDEGGADWYSGYDPLPMPK